MITVSAKKSLGQFHFLQGCKNTVIKWHQRWCFVSPTFFGQILLLILSFNDCAHYNTLTHLSTKLCPKKIAHELTPINFCEKNINTGCTYV